jgi:hypothetical protein
MTKKNKKEPEYTEERGVALSDAEYQRELYESGVKELTEVPADLITGAVCHFHITPAGEPLRKLRIHIEEVDSTTDSPVGLEPPDLGEDSAGHWTNASDIEIKFVVEGKPVHPDKIHKTTGNLGIRTALALFDAAHAMLHYNKDVVHGLDEEGMDPSELEERLDTLQVVIGSVGAAHHLGIRRKLFGSWDGAVKSITKIAPMVSIDTLDQDALDRLQEYMALHRSAPKA